MDEFSGADLSPRGLVMEKFARDKRGIRKISQLHRFLKQRAPELGLEPKAARTRTTVSNYLHGITRPDEEWMDLFALAFELTPEEMGELAFANSFRTATAA